MAGLMDFLQNPATMNMAASLLESGGPSTTPIGTGQAIGRSLLAYQQGSDLAMQRKLREAQIAKMMQQQEDEQRQREFFRGAASRFAPTAQQQALAQHGGPTITAAEAVPTLQDQPMDMSGLYREMLSVPGMETSGIAGMQKLAKEQAEANAPIKLGEGDTLLDPKSMQPVYSSGPKLPWYVQRGEGGQPGGINPLYRDFEMMKARAAAPSVKVDVKTGESIGTQVGPMLKESKLQASGAVKMFDSAERIEKALASGKVSAGPLASKTMTVKQFIYKTTGGNAEDVKQTRQTIRALSEMAVEARKELAGQGQVTESEAKAVERAMAGNIDELTTGELAEIAKLTKRASNYRVRAHQDMVDEVGRRPDTKGLTPFYKIPGSERVLKYTGDADMGGIAKISSDADYNALPSGAVFTGPDGKRRRKP